MSSSPLLPAHAPQDLLPEKRMLFQPNLAKAAGSSFIQGRIERLRPIAHVFGHTHFLWDQCLDGERYCHWPLGYPRERRWVPTAL